ncbi:Chitin synthase, class 2 [Mortierella sp. AD094]|nr:Chitin synthase, class 2 [Mortierella sp. AD094]
MKREAELALTAPRIRRIRTTLEQAEEVGEVVEEQELIVIEDDEEEEVEEVVGLEEVIVIKDDDEDEEVVVAKDEEAGGEVEVVIIDEEEEQEEQEQAQPTVDWGAKLLEISALAQGSFALYACFLSAIAIIRQHCEETDDTSKDTKIITVAVQTVTGAWTCTLMLPPVPSASPSPLPAIVFRSGPFPRKDIATCLAAFMACSDLGLDVPFSDPTPPGAPTQVFRCIGSKFLKMAYAIEGYINLPLAHEGDLTQRSRSKLRSQRLYDCARALDLSTFMNRVGFSAKAAARFVKSIVAFAYCAGGESLALQVLIGVVGPMEKISGWDDFGHLRELAEPRKVPFHVPEDRLDQVEIVLAHKFMDRSILVESLTHVSASGSSDFTYERLEFLGDAVLDFAVIQYWLGRDPAMKESNLENKIQQSTNNNALGTLCVEKGIHRFMHHRGLGQDLNRGEQVVLGAGTRERCWEGLKLSKNGFANIVESVFGAVFVDSNFQSNMYLAEDRILCFEPVARKNEAWPFKYVKSVKASTNVPDSIGEFTSQRHRRLNGSLLVAFYSVAHFTRVLTSGQGFFRKIFLMLTIMLLLKTDHS